MIVYDPVDRFETNFGVNPNSISLKPAWTTPYTASNIEAAGNTFDTEDDFGDGMTGINDFGLGSFFSNLAEKIDNLRFGGQSRARSASHGVFPVEARSTKEWGTPTAQAHAAQKAQIISTNPMQGSVPSTPAVQFKPPVNWTQMGWGYGPGSKIEFVSDRPIMGAHVTSGKGTSGIGDLIPEELHTALDVSTLILWPAVLYGGYSVFKALTSSAPAQRRKAAISKAKEDLRKAKQLSRWRDE